MCGEVYDFADAFDRAFIIRKNLELIQNMKLPLHKVTHSKQLFDTVIKGHQTTEKD